MSHRKHWTPVSGGSASVGLIAFVVLLAGGCGPNSQDAANAKGQCDSSFDDGNPCTVDSCMDGMNKHTTLRDGTDCVLRKNPGKCMAGACRLACESMPLTCKCGKSSDCQ